MPSFNFLTDLFSKEELEDYQITIPPFKMKVLRDKLDEKIKEDPDYEVFVPLVYYRVRALQKDKRLNLVVSFHDVFISNKGNLFTIKSKGVHFYKSHSSYGYRLTVIAQGGKRYPILLHRAMACSFVPVDTSLKRDPKTGGVLIVDLNHMTVNHLNGVKSSLDLKNLEWTTFSGNIQHAYDTGLLVSPGGTDNTRTKIVKGVGVKGPLLGKAFILIGEKEIVTSGFNQGNVHSCCRGSRETHKGCVWSFATEEEIATLPRGLPTI